MTKRNVVGGLALVSLGAAAAVATSHVQVHWGPSAQAAPVVAGRGQAGAAAAVEGADLRRAHAQPHVRAGRVAAVAVGGAHQHHQGRRQGHAARMRRAAIRSRARRSSASSATRTMATATAAAAQPKQTGLGSGVVIDKKGYILTNNHVVEDADDVKVTLRRRQDRDRQGRRHRSAAPTSRWSRSTASTVQPAKLGDSDKLQVGEWVIAIGNPFGLDHTVTVGVLSAKNRSGFQGGGHFEDFLQTDASINPGNSGGPLVNLDGEVIGINTMIAGIGTGIGFAVPSSMFKTVADQLIQSGQACAGRTSASACRTMTPELAQGPGQERAGEGRARRAGRAGLAGGQGRRQAGRRHRRASTARQSTARRTCSAPSAPARSGRRST